ncbi:Glutamyl-tRNA(Gln) amidotransferase subunit B, mitochondrial [[Candida] zeylanoides]
MSKRYIASTSKRAFQPLAEYALKCGLELHTQLKTTHKLFSLTATGPINAAPNTHVSYFDMGLPGTQPKLNPEALLLALKAAAALDCTIHPVSSFDRKHYFYPDQPLGYQITQFYKPLATQGQLTLSPAFDDVDETKRIGIQQVQIEQDTGRSSYRSVNDQDDVISVDLNRANTPLIELVTHPDFETTQQVRAFIKKYQQLVKYLDICSGELETGAIRVDVNVSVNGGGRAELKNLRSTSDIVRAIEHEYLRQIDLIKAGTPLQSQETRSWDGSTTSLSRTKEGAMDYRYFPDSELPYVTLDSDIKRQIIQNLPELPEKLQSKLAATPYNLDRKHINFLIDNKEILAYYSSLHSLVTAPDERFGAVDGRFAGNWVFNNLLATFKKLNKPVELASVPQDQFALLIKAVVSGSIQKADASALLRRAIESSQPLSVSYSQTKGDVFDVDSICATVINQNPDIVAKIKAGNTNSIKYLLGLVMRASLGKADSTVVAKKLDKFLT